MIKLTKLFELVGMENLVTVYEGAKKIYFGKCSKCPAKICEYTYVKEMKFSNETFRYIINVRYM